MMGWRNGKRIIGHILLSFFFRLEGGEYWEGRAVEWVGLGRENIVRWNVERGGVGEPEQ